MRFTFFLLTLTFAVPTAALHLLALHFALYWIFPWFDMLVHTFGGITVAFLLAALFHPYIPPKRFFLYTVGLVITVGLMWELFEFILGVTRNDPAFWSDSLSDLLCDVVGGVFGTYISARILQGSYGATEN